jgi:hypothetical protein
MSDDQRRLLSRMGVGGVADISFTKRLRAMLPSAPVHRLSHITGWRDWGEAPYDPRALSIAAIDAVIARQGIGVGLEYDDLVLDIAQLARLAAPGRPEDESLDVAKYVVDGLLNNRDGNAGGAFRFSYSDYREGHTTREVAFYLLVERTRADGRIVLEASVEAVNALRGGLNMNVEDAQTAMRFILEVQIKEGRRATSSGVWRGPAITSAAASKQTASCSLTSNRRTSSMRPPPRPPRASSASLSPH